MGGDRVTVRNLKVVQVDAENNLLVVRGAIPGAPGSYHRRAQGDHGEEDRRAAGREASKQVAKAPAKGKK